MIFIGVDNGLGGAIAKIDTDPAANKKIEIIDMPTLSIVSNKKHKQAYDIPAIICLLKSNGAKNLFCSLESAQAMPGQGVTSMFSIGYGYGIFQGVLSTLQIPFATVRPQAWKKMFGLLNKEKDDSVIIAERLFPGVSFRGPRGGILNGRSDALLIAEYARRTANSVPSEGIVGPDDMFGGQGAALQ
jgi:crossover junction endodeoxyribonuclease RuvC